jgi:hypothetical protein
MRRRQVTHSHETIHYRDTLDLALKKPPMERLHSKLVVVFRLRPSTAHPESLENLDRVASDED